MTRALAWVVLLGFAGWNAAAEPGEPRPVGDLRSSATLRFEGPRLLSLAAAGSHATALLTSGTDGVVLWSSDGTPEGSGYLLQPCATTADVHSTGTAGGRFWFATCGLFVSDGTAPGTRQLPIELVFTRPILGAFGPTGRLLVTGRHAQWGIGLFLEGEETADVTPLAQGSFGPVEVALSGLGASAAVGGRLAFLVERAASRELWITDGTAAGTFRLRALPGALGIAALGDRILVVAPGDGGARDLLLVESRAGGRLEALGRNVDLVATGASRAYFASHGDGGSELWTTEGTPSSTRRLFQFGDLPGVRTSMVVGNRLYFLSGLGLGTSDGTRVDPLPGVITLGGDDPSVQLVLQALSSGRGVIAGGRRGSEMGLWSAGAGGDVTQIGRCVSPVGDCAEGVRLLPSGSPGRVFLEELLGDDKRALRTDGTPAGTADLGIFTSADLPVLGVGLASGMAVGGAASQDFRLFSLAPERSRLELLRGSGQIADHGSAPEGLARLGGEVFFRASDDGGAKVFRTDGVGLRDEFTATASSPAPSYYDSGSSDPLLVWDETPSLRRLWRAGFLSGPALVRESEFPVGHLGPTAYFTNAGKLYRAAAGLSSYELVADLAAGDGLDHRVSEIVAVGANLDLFDNVYATPGSPVVLRTEWWRIDGLGGGVVRLTGAFPLSPVRVARPFGNGLLAFAARSVVFVPLDGSALRVLETSPANDPFRFHQELVTSGDRAFYLAWRPGPNDHQELWVTDGTVSGTRRLTTPQRCLPVRSPTSFLTAFRGGVAFVAQDPTGGEELWFSNGTSPGTRRVADLRPGLAGSLPRSLGAHGDKLFFSASDGLHGRELWVTDGTTAGTARLTDLAPGARSSNPTAMTGLGGDVLFAADEGDWNRELWAIAATAAGEPAPAAEPEPPGPWHTDSALPGFRFKVLVANGDQWAETQVEPACLPETVCLSGAVPGRPEVFLRVVGPKPNGYLWPTLAKFTTSAVQVWIGQEATGQVRYYWLDPAQVGFDELAALFDRTGFVPTGASAASQERAAGRAEPPAGSPWFTTPEVPGFRIAVAIAGPGGTIPTRKDALCIAETLCVSGAIPGRSEVFVRVVGPKPNGRLWPTLVRFTTSPVEVWIEQLASGERRHYALAAPAVGRDELTGLFDREGFVP